jgi:hypothetical protein
MTNEPITADVPISNWTLVQAGEENNANQVERAG